jgi:hypothetical protein
MANKEEAEATGKHPFKVALGKFPIHEAGGKTGKVRL